MVSNQYFLHVGKTHKSWTYRVTIQGRSYSLQEFCDKLGLRYNSVAIAIRRKGLMTGLHQKPFVDILSAMVKRKTRGFVPCPCCVGSGKIPVKYDPAGRGFKLKPTAAPIIWMNPDGTAPTWAKTITPASDDSPESNPAGDATASQ